MVKLSQKMIAVRFDTSLSVGIEKWVLLAPRAVASPKDPRSPYPPRAVASPTGQSVSIFFGFSFNDLLKKGDNNENCRFYV